MNPELLQGSFTVTPEPGLDTLDPRWSELSGLAQDGRFAEAGAMSEELIRQSVYDVRVIGYFCFGCFLEGGPASLGAIAGALSSVLNGNWEAVGPAPSRAKLTQQSLAWLWKQVLKQMQHCESMKGEEWQTWQEAAPEAIDEALTGLFELQQALGPRLDKGAATVLEPLAKVQAWLRSFQSTLQRAPGVAGEPANEDAGEDGDEDEGAGDAPGKPTAAARAAAPAPAAAATANGDAGSYHLAQLLRKIDAFARLIEGGKLTAALIVADDIEATLGKFDPLLYFPKLFARFIQLAAVHAGELAKVQGEREGASWKALRSLYQVDLDLFLALD